MARSHTSGTLSEAELSRLLDHTEWLRGLARRLVHDTAVADDLVQETWLAALRSPPDADLPVRPWLAGVVRKLALMHRRGEGRRVAREGRVARDEALPSTDALVAEVDLERSLKDLVLRLDEPVRTTVLLRYHEGLSSAEIARRQRVPAGTVRWRLKRGLDLLRVELDERYGGRGSWLGAFAAFGRVDGAAAIGAASGGVGVGPAGVLGALVVLVAAALAALVFGRGACVAGSGDRATALGGRDPVPPAGAGVDRAVAEAPLASATSALRQQAPSTAPTPVALPPLVLALRDDAGAPVTGASVVAQWRGGLAEGETDAAGHVELGDATGALVVFVSRPGAFLVRLELDSPPRSNGVPYQVEARIPRGRTLSGRVEVDGRVPREPVTLELDSDTHLFGGAEVPRAVAARLGNGRRTRVVTDGDGWFRFHGIASSWAGVLWLPREYRAVVERTGAYGDESFYFDAPRDGVVLRLARREEAVPSRQEPRPPSETGEPLGYTLELRVVDPGGAPVGGVFARFDRGPMLVSHADPARPRVRPFAQSHEWTLFALGRDGVLTLADVSSRHEVSITVEDACGSQLARRLLECPVDRVGADPAPRAVTVVVEAALRPLTIIVRDEAGGMLLGAVVQLEGPGGPGTFRRTGLDGCTTFDAVEVGTQALDILVQKRGYVTRRLVGAPLPPDDQPLEVTLASGVDILMVVTDPAGAPVTDAEVVAMPESERGATRAAVHAGGGRYRLDDLPRGRLAVEARTRELLGRAEVTVAEPREVSLGLAQAAAPGPTGG